MERDSERRREDALPIASAAAWSPNAQPAQRSPLLGLESDDPMLSGIRPGPPASMLPAEPADETPSSSAEDGPPPSPSADVIELHPGEQRDPEPDVEVVPESDEESPLSRILTRPVFEDGLPSDIRQKMFAAAEQIEQLREEAEKRAEEERRAAEERAAAERREAEERAAAERREAEERAAAEARAAETGAGPRPDRLAALRDVARKLRTAPDANETLQFIVDTACSCTGSDAGMLTVNQPEQRQVTSGLALGAGPYISVQLRAGGPTFGELVLTRMSGAEEFESEDETFAELVAEYIAKAVSAMRRGTVLSGDQQDFIDRITEEIRSPLAGGAHMLKTVLSGDAGPVGEEQRAYIAAVAKDTRRLLAQVDSLLALAHLRPPELREMQTIPVGPWLKRSVEAHRQEAIEKRIELKLSEVAEAWLIKGVPAQLELVMSQLLSNSLKFCDEGGHINVSAMIYEGMLRVDVADDGMGFDNADASRMLDIFSRAINADAARIPGMGVGLFLCAEIAKNHGGRVWLESRRDEGTVAHVAIPLAPAV